MSEPVKVSKSQILVRAATDTDINFIFNSWLKSYKASAYAKYIPNPVYYDLHHKAIEAILARSQVLIAANLTDHKQIYGYLCFERQQGVPVVHYGYTKDAYRRMGVLQLLFTEAALPEVCFYTHSTLYGSHALKKLAPKFVYNPYLAFLELKV